jgi:hypothetical protein
MARQLTWVLIFVLAGSACSAPEASVSSPTPSQPSVTSTPTVRPSVDLLAALLDPKVSSWKPTEPTLLVTIVREQEGSLVAVPLSGAPATVLATVHDLSGSVPALVLAASRLDGSLIALALATGTTTRNIALLDLAAGRARWLTTPAAGGSMAGAPTWAADANSLYYGSSDPSARGVSHVGVDGTVLPAVPLDPAFGSLLSVSRVTREGTLIGADEFNGPTLWAMDPATGRKVSFGEHNSALVAWRSSSPRALVSAVTNIAAPGAGYLALWDDATGQKTVILTEPVAGADFDPTGERVVAAVTDRGDQQLRLRVMKADGSGATTLAGTENARDPLWTDAGIAYHTYVRAGPNEVRIVLPGGGSSRVLYRTNDTIQRTQLIVPAH